MERPEVKYAESGDLSIAYCQYGNGRRTSSSCPASSPTSTCSGTSRSRRASSERGEYARVLTFDKRGTGLSDRSVGSGQRRGPHGRHPGGHGRRRLERAALHGVSEGGPMAIMFAATYPERVVVAHAVQGTFARLLADVDYDGLAAGVRRARSWTRSRPDGARGDVIEHVPPERARERWIRRSSPGTSAARARRAWPRS